MGLHKNYQLHKKSQKKNVKARLLHNTLLIVSCGLIISGAAVSIYDWRSNQTANQKAEQLIYQANHGESQAVPSTIKPTAKLIDSYVVAPSLPRYLYIPKLNVNARILPVSLGAHGALGTPNNVYDTAWYDESAEPGQPSTMLIDGHISSWTTHGVFYGLDTLKPGDAIDVRSGSGAIFTYKVIKTQVYSANNVNMATAMSPIITGKPSLNLISCTGDVNAGTNEFNQRIIVFASEL